LLPAGAVAGWGLHPLESAAFARRTQIAVVPDDVANGSDGPEAHYAPKHLPSGTTSWSRPVLLGTK
jgi:hypothetical protein